MRRAAWVYIYAVLAAATLLSAATFVFPPPIEPPLWLFMLLVLATSLMRVFVVAAPNFRSYEGSTICLIAALLLLPPWQFVLVVAISHLIEWVKERWTSSPLLRNWYIQPFNMAKVVLSGFAAYFVLDATLPVRPGGSQQIAFLAVLGVIITYVGVNQLLLGIVLYLARGIKFRDAGILRDGLLIEIPLACIGYLAFYLLESSPYLGLLVLAPIVLIYQAFTLPRLQYQAMKSMERANQELIKANESIQQLNQDLFLTLAKIFDARDPYVGGHAAQVATYAVAIARELGLAPERIEVIRQAAFLHDIGKIAFPESILHSPAALTDAQYGLIKKHTDIGADFLATSQGLRHLAPLVRHHHERWDGAGYPARLAGEAIPLESRILNLSDSVEAMASDRPYHRAMSTDEIIREIRRCSGTQFDPKVVETFIAIVDRKGPGFVINSARAVAAQFADTGLTVEGFPADLFARRYIVAPERDA